MEETIKDKDTPARRRRRRKRMRTKTTSEAQMRAVAKWAKAHKRTYLLTYYRGKDDDIISTLDVMTKRSVVIGELVRKHYRHDGDA